MSKEILDLLRDNGIGIGKISGSCSGIHQAADISPIFRNIKQAIKVLRDRATIVFNPVLNGLIVSAISEMEQEKSLKVDSTQKSKIAQGCVVITRAMQDRPIPKYIRQVYEDCEQMPLNFDVIMGRCIKKITHDIMAELTQASESDLLYFQQHGYITDERLAKSHVALIESTASKPRDQRPLSNQRAIILNHAEDVSEYLSRQIRGEDVGEALLNENDPANRKELKAALKLAETKKKQEEKKELEKKRKQTMTPEELAAEKAAKKQATETRKKARADKEQAAFAIVESTLIKHE
jgi:hypothetical protein